MSEHINTRQEVGDQECLESILDGSISGAFYEDVLDTNTAYTYKFNKCTNLELVEMENIKAIGTHYFDGCSSLERIDLPSFTGILSGEYKFKSCPALHTLGIKGENISSDSITSNVSGGLKHLIFYDTVAHSLSSFSYLLSSHKLGYGCFYVQPELVDTYKNATNWSMIARNIHSIEDYPVEPEFDTIDDDWYEIMDACNDGSYKTKYRVGDVKSLTLFGAPIAMEIVAMDADVLSSDHQTTVPITWVSKWSIESRKFNNTRTISGGWASSDIRSYLANDVFSALPQEVKNNIKTVDKTYYVYADSRTYTAQDKVWIPSYREVGLGTGSESSGAIYSGRFMASSDRVKYYLQSISGEIDGNAANWWTRSCYTSSGYMSVVSTSGAATSAYSDTDRGVIFGFCT